MLVSIVCYFMLFSVALAFNVTIYKGAAYHYNKNPEPVRIVEEMYKFEINMNVILDVQIRFKNRAPDVVARAYITYKQSTMNKTGDAENKTMSKCDKEDCWYIQLTDEMKTKNSTSVSIGIQLEKQNVTCATQIILEGDATLPDATKKDTDRSLCLDVLWCTVVMDVQNACQGQLPEQENKMNDGSSLTFVLLTGLAVVLGVAVIVSCVVILRMQKCCSKDSTSNELPQTYTPRNPFYVNLLFRKECQAEIYAAEHIYEEIK